MNRLGTALLAAVEAIVTVGVGVGIALVPLTLLWGFEYGLQVDWDVFWKAAGSVWLVGHGVDVTFVLGSAAAKASGVSGAGAPIAVTLAALGFAVVTAWLGGRAGRRFAETDHRVTGVLVGTGVVAVLGLGLALSSTSAASHPTVWQAVVFPALWFGIPALVAAEVTRRRRSLAADRVTARVVALADRVPAVWRAVIGFGFRAGTAASAMVVAVAAVVVGFVLLGSFAEVITLYERSHAGVVGGISLTIGQLAFLPDFIGWATAWLVGPGFSIGTGSSVSPIGTTLGPIPALPVFGALPAAGHTFGLLWVLVPVLAGFAAGGLLRPRLVRALGTADSALFRAAGGLATGIVAGIATGLVAWLSSGSFGPGRLADVGPDALAVGALAALEVGVPAIVALAVGQDLVRMPERTWQRERWHETEDDTAESVEQAGSLLDALDRAGAGRTTDVHRFVVTEAHDAPARAGATAAPTPSDDVTEPIADDVRVVTDAARASRPAPSAPTGPERDADADVELPEWARTGAVGAPMTEPASPSTTGRRGGSIRDRLRDAADGVRDRTDGLRARAGGLRDRAGDLRDRVTGADAERPDAARPDAVRSDAARSDAARSAQPGTVRDERPREAAAAGLGDEQPAFPWSTEEFVAGRDDEPADPAPATPPTRPRWDATDQVADEDLPWWRRSEDDRT
ncbi:DUF6350 family protein [Curtobacterium sp. 9128]|uniref:cell division protein PerM n=1 Tax=Curtobacterium sp. 9128 TaxID=1793722 RepID=UPI0011A66B8E|nr:DUF6350 family protein [Curtobacterium sp. 9128]